MPSNFPSLDEINESVLQEEFAASEVKRTPPTIATLSGKNKVHALVNLAARHLLNQRESFQAMDECIHEIKQENEVPPVLIAERFNLFKEKLNVNLFHKLIIKGEYKQVEKILQKAQYQPEQLRLLLKSTSQLMTFSGDTVEGTALRLALGAKDVDVVTDKGVKVVNGMTELVQSYLRLLPEGEEEIKNQIADQFPDGWEEKQAQKEQNDLAALEKVFKAIVNSKKDTDCETALQKFRDYFAPKYVIRAGHHFNENLLLKAIELCVNYWDKNPYDSRKDILMGTMLIGYIQRFVPACLAQVLSQGIYYVMEEGEIVKREFKLRNWRNDYSKESYFPLAPKSGLGFQYYMAWCAESCWTLGISAEQAARLSKLMSSKNNIVAEYYATARQAVKVSL